MPRGIRRPLWAAGCAVLLAVSVAGCASNSASPHVASLGSTTTTLAANNENSILPGQQQIYRDQVAYAGCMRTHGLPNYPFPPSNPSGREQSVDDQQDTKSPAYPAANRSCRHLLPFGGGFPSGAELAEVQNQLLTFSVCMRRHGVANFPDPFISRHALGFRLSGVNPSSKIFQHAQRSCGLPGGGP